MSEQKPKREPTNNTNTPTATGIELIAKERQEQIEKHGFDITHDAFYSDNELIKAALFAIEPRVFEWPFDWDESFREKIKNKDTIQRLTIAGALIAAAIDRQKFKDNEGIDRLIR